MKKFFLAFLFTAFCTNFAYSFDSSTYVVIKDKINVRVDSTVLSDSLGQLSKGQEVKVLKENFQWYKVELPEDFICYIASEFTKILPNNQIRVTGTKVNLRSHPSLDSHILGKAPKDAILPFIDKDNEWIKVKGNPYISGWAHKSLLKKLDEKSLPQKDDSNLSSFLIQIIPKLSNPNMLEKGLIHQNIIDRGEEIIPILDTHMPNLDKNASYSIIHILTVLGKKNPNLISHFFEKIDPSSIKTSSMYLDVIQALLGPKDPLIPYFYLSQENKITPEHIENAKSSLTLLYTNTLQ